MAYDFSETFTLEIPRVNEGISSFSESEYKKGHGLVIQIAAIHAGMTANYRSYDAKELEAALTSWTHPYPKPVILNHDLMSEPMGRIIGASMDSEADGTPFTMLQAAITDPIAIQKVLDKRYLTGSVGGKANEALCSICDVDWARPREGSALPCRHRPGKVYSGKVAMTHMRDISFKEYSFVNVPADSKSSIRTMTEAEESDDWTPKARFFVFDIDKESVMECTESANIDVLAEMKKKDASSLYLGLKGAFIAAHANFDEYENKDGVNARINDTNAVDDLNSEENVMAKETHEAHEEDDILAVTEGLSEDLNQISEEANAEEEESKEELSAEQAEETVEEETSNEEVAEEETVEEDTEEEGEESAEEAEEALEPETAESDESQEVEETEDEVEEGTASEQTDETELNESSEAAESRVEELEAEVEALKEENRKLKKALHRTLAERVVDAKISAGILESEDRAAALEEHGARTASSLADSLRDVAAMPRKAAVTLSVDELEITPKSEVVDGESQVVTIGEDEDSKVEESPMAKAERLFADVLLGKTRLN